MLLRQAFAHPRKLRALPRKNSSDYRHVIFILLVFLILAI
jgi:hypothetical protein